MREWDSGIAVRPDWEQQYRSAWERPGRSVGVGESLEALQQRAVAALQEIARTANDNADVVAGSHGTWIAMALRGLGCAVDTEFWFNMPMPAVFELETHRDKMHATSHPIPI